MRSICAALGLAAMCGGCGNRATSTPGFQAQVGAALFQSEVLKGVPPDAAVLFVAPYGDQVQAKWTRDRADRQSWLTACGHMGSQPNAWPDAETFPRSDLSRYTATHAAEFVFCDDEGLRRSLIESWPASVPHPVLLPDPDQK